MNEIKEEKKKSNAGLIAIIMVLCLLLGAAGGYILHDKLAKDKPETKEETKKEEEKKPEEKKEETPTTSKNETVVKSFGDDCSFTKDCEKEFELTNGEKTYKIKATKKDYIVIITVDGKELVKYNTITNPHAIENIALLDNNYFIVETSIYAGPNEKFIVRDYFDSKLNKIAYVFDQPTNKIEGNLTSKEVIYTDSICDHMDDKTPDYSINIDKYKLVLNDNDKYEITKIGRAVEGQYGNC